MATTIVEPTKYQQLLRSPKWQRRRLLELDRANFGCEACGERDKELQIHHLKYDNESPWSVPAGWLEVLCVDCHEWREHWNKIFGRTLAPTSYYKTIASGGLATLLNTDNVGRGFDDENIKQYLNDSLQGFLRNILGEYAASGEAIALRHLALAIERERPRHLQEWLDKKEAEDKATT